MKLKKTLKWGLFIFIILFVISTSYLVGTFQKVKISYDKTQITTKMNNKKVLKNLEPVSFLILGIDEREGDKGRSDTILVGTIDPNKNEGFLISLPRDTRVMIPSLNKKDKINHAYAFGGIDLATETVESFLDVPINFVAKINIVGFSQIIDLIGGITVNNPTEFSYNQNKFHKGKIRLSGKSALNYIKMRKADSEGDFGRQKRQQLVLNGLMNEITSGKSILDLTSISTIIGNNLETNIKIENIQKLQNDYTGGFKAAKQMTLSKGTEKKINGVYYYEPNTNELNTIKKQLHEQLNTK